MNPATTETKTTPSDTKTAVGSNGVTENASAAASAKLATLRTKIAALLLSSLEKLSAQADKAATAYDGGLVKVESATSSAVAKARAFGPVARAGADKGIEKLRWLVPRVLGAGATA